MKITTVNPATEEVLAEYDAIPVEQVKLKEVTEKEAMDQFVNTKIGEPSRMGSK